MKIYGVNDLITQHIDSGYDLEFSLNFDMNPLFYPYN